MLRGLSFGGSDTGVADTGVLLLCFGGGGGIVAEEAGVLRRRILWEGASIIGVSLHSF